MHSPEDVKETLQTIALPASTLMSTPRGCIDESHTHVGASFDAIYERHVVFVWRTLRAFGISGNALEDAVQDVFVVVHRNLASFEGRAKITTWLFEIARRVARDYRRERRSDEDLPITEILDPRPTPFDEAASAEAVALLERILDRIDEKHRVCFVLMELEQMTAEQAASLLGINVNTVYTRTRRARIELERLIELYGFEP